MRVRNPGYRVYNIYGKTLLMPHNIFIKIISTTFIDFEGNISALVCHDETDIQIV